LESPAGIPWEQEALVTVGGAGQRKGEKRKKGHREEGGDRD
jgi:hypothetical protein